MINHVIRRLFATMSLFILLAPLFLQHAPARAFPDNCGLHPSNLFRNGSMAPGHDTPYGVVANEWEPFVFAGSPPRFEWVDNEKWDANGGQYFWSDGTPFDAGIRQTVGHLQPGVFYRYRIGYSHARLDPGNTKNEVHPDLGRQVGVDPLGGIDPHASSILWGSAVFGSSAGMNLPELTMTFAARSDKATIYFRGISKAGFGRSKVWFDVACMEPLPDMATATPLAPTATPVPPTATPRPTQPPTKVAAKPATVPPAATQTSAPTTIPTPEATPTDAATHTPSPTARFARAIATPTSGGLPELNADLLTGLGITSILGSFLFFAFGLVLSRRVH